MELVTQRTTLSTSIIKNIQESEIETLIGLLLPGSPALDQIPAGMYGCGTSITADQRGVIRPQGNGCDIGAYKAAYFCGADCNEGYPDGTIITLTAIMMTRGLTVTASFEQTRFDIYLPLVLQD